MKTQRWLIATAAILFPLALQAFDPTPRAERVLLLDSGAPRDVQGIRAAFRSELRERLREGGFEVIEPGLTYDEALREHNLEADFVLDIIGESAHTADYGGIGIGGRHADVGLSMIGSRVVARLLVYDGPTMELLGDRTVTQRASAVVPSAVGFGSRALYAFIGLPLIEAGQQRSIARAAGREAAAWSVAVMRGESETPR